MSGPTGKQIVTEEPATAELGGKVQHLRNATHVLYDDGSDDYRCDECGKTWPTGLSVRSHQAAHSDVREAKKLLLAKRAQAERRSAGVKKGNEERKARQEAVRQAGAEATLRAAAGELVKVAKSLEDVAELFKVPASRYTEDQIRALEAKAAQLDGLRKAIGAVTAG